MTKIQLTKGELLRQIDNFDNLPERIVLDGIEVDSDVDDLAQRYPELMHLFTKRTWAVFKEFKNNNNKAGLKEFRKVFFSRRPDTTDIDVVVCVRHYICKMRKVFEEHNIPMAIVTHRHEKSSYELIDLEEVGAIPSGYRPYSTRHSKMALTPS